MEKEFLPYGLAIKLKELGFEFYPLGYYSLLEDNKIIESKFYASDDFLEAPLWQQAFDWLLDRVGRVNHSFPYLKYYDKNEMYLMSTDTSGEDIHLTRSGDKQECLEKLIELCKNK